ncbi:hypothetical protein ACFX2I_025068 [Malus domestica]
MPWTPSWWDDFDIIKDQGHISNRIGHANTECSGLPGQGNVATYGEWTRTASIRDEVKVQHPLSLNVGEMRVAGATRGGSGTNSQRHVRATEGMETGRSMGGLRGPHQQDEAHNLRSGSLDTQAVRIHEIDDEGVQISASLGVESNPGQLLRKDLQDNIIRRSSKREPYQLEHGGQKKNKVGECSLEGSGNCLKVEHTTSVNEASLKVPEEHQELGKQVQVGSELQNSRRQAKGKGVFSLGGGGWPTTAAREP